MKRGFVSIFTGCVALAGAALADAPPKAVASIKPVHSLLAGVMEGAGRPTLLVSGGDSPHTYTMRPSDARALEEADFVVWVGEHLEGFLIRPIDAIADDAHVLEVSRADSIVLLRSRRGEEWEPHDDDHDDDHHRDDDHRDREEEHDNHDDDDHHDDKDDGHGHHDEDRDGHEHDDEKDNGHRHDNVHVHHEDEDGHHGHGEFDLHLWLDPVNAATAVKAMADTLARIDPERADLYQRNGEALQKRLSELDAELREQLTPVRERGFVVFHDAWQYLDFRYQLRALGSVTVSPERPPGAARLADIRHHLVEDRVVCIFAEPQFEPRLVRTLVEGTNVKPGVLDPLGAALPEGPDLYFTLMRNNANALRDCLSGS